jgi:uncharacterized protein (DUF1015 family)
MAIVKPFRGIRPSPDKVHLVASRPVDSYKPQQLNAKLAENPYTFLHVIKPEFGQAVKSKTGSNEQLTKIKAKFKEFIHQQIFIQDEEEVFYIYKQINKNRSSSGLIACASIDDYFNNVIKKHEHTLTHKEELLKNYLKVCDYNAEPVSLTYPADSYIDALTEKVCANTNPIYDFTTTDSLRHQLWKIDKKEDKDLIIDRFQKIKAIYIADGHHRTASSALLGKEKREQKVHYSGSEAFNYFVAIFFPDHELNIYDYNRAIRDLNLLSSNQFLEKIGENFQITKKEVELYSPSQIHEFSMYLEGNWYSLIAKKGTFNPSDPIDSLDASILSNKILGPILNITDLKTDKRVGFISGIKGAKELKHQVDTFKMKVSFGLFPVSIEQLKLISDTNNIMPPKSTWVEPKLRSGLTVFSLE